MDDSTQNRESLTDQQEPPDTLGADIPEPGGGWFDSGLIRPVLPTAGIRVRFPGESSSATIQSRNR